MTSTHQREGSWRELLGRENGGASTVLAGGVALFAVNVYLTTSLLPTAVSDIGGQRYYAWVSSVFMVASVISATMVSPLLVRRGARSSYLVALVLFGFGTAICIATPTMEVLLTGRVFQGLGGGLLSGLGYAVINSALPQRLWTRGTALVSAMWGVGTFLGPALGGIFSQFHAWRGAFAVLLVGTVLLAVLVPRAIPGGGTTGESAVPRVPFLPLVTLTASVMLVSVAGILTSRIAIGVAVVGAVLLLIGFLRADKGTSREGILPRSTYAATPLKWIYLTIAFLVIALMVETFVPLFGQRIGGLPPVLAGFLGAVLALGWTLGEIPSAGVTRASSTRRIIVVGPLLVAVGLAITGLLQFWHPAVIIMLAWALALGVAGAGIGIAWPHLATSAMSAVSDPVEAGKAAASVSTVQLIANAFGAAIAGLLVNLGGADMVRSAHLLLFGFAIVALLGVVSAARVGRANVQQEHVKQEQGAGQGHGAQQEQGGGISA
jgi:MFS family permease